jgi:hypothetical protein
MTDLTDMLSAWSILRTKFHLGKGKTLTIFYLLVLWRGMVGSLFSAALRKVSDVSRYQF